MLFQVHLEDNDIHARLFTASIFQRTRKEKWAEQTWNTLGGGGGERMEPNEKYQAQRDFIREFKDRLKVWEIEGREQSNARLTFP